MLKALLFRKVKKRSFKDQSLVMYWVLFYVEGYPQMLGMIPINLFIETEVSLELDEGFRMKRTKYETFTHTLPHPPKKKTYLFINLTQRFPLS